jgi:tetratricopeptide (TPR) repeat protein
MAVNLSYFNLIFRILIIGLLFSNTSEAHGDLHQRIQNVTNQIQTNPDSTYLYLKRGILYYQHEQFEKSLQDLKECEMRKYSDKILDLTFAKTYQKMGALDQSLNYLAKIIKKDDKYVNAWRLQGQVYFEKGEFEQASKSYMNVIHKAIRRLPSNYIDASLSFEKIENGSGKEKSISVINKAIMDLGPLMTFYDRMVYLGLKYEDYDLAIENQNNIVEISQRKESSLYKRAQVQVHFGNVQRAKYDLHAAKKAIESLPPRLIKTTAMIELQKQINNQIENF